MLVYISVLTLYAKIYLIYSIHIRLSGMNKKCDEDITSGHMILHNFLIITHIFYGVMECSKYYLQSKIILFRIIHQTKCRPAKR